MISTIKTNVAADFDEVRDVTVVGAGPVGLWAAFWCGMCSARVRIIDSLRTIGGQCAALYPETLIYDVPGHPAIPAVQLVENLRRQALEPFDVPVHLDTAAHAISWADDHVVLHTNRGDLRSRTVVLAGGHEEVRKLAEESQSAAAEIADLIGEIQTETGRVVAVVAEGAKRTDEGVSTVQRTRAAFEQIGTAVEDMSARVAEIATAVAQIAAEAQRAESEVTEVASVAEESSASAEQVSASTQETSASTEEITASAQTLAGTANELVELVTPFKLTA